MSILNQLSSQVGERSEGPNRRVADRCLGEPGLLPEIAPGLGSDDAALAGDCAEVLTLVAEQRPNLVAPYAGAISALLGHKTTRVRWEAAHALAYIAGAVPEAMSALLPKLAGIIHADASIIVRDYLIDALGNYATTSPLAAEQASPYLKEALTAWDGRHAAHALNGLANVAKLVPSNRAELHAIAGNYLNDPKGVTRKAAKALLKTVKLGI